MSTAAMRLVLVRHGEADANVERRYLGSRDDQLTEQGRWQATRLAGAIALLPIAAVYTSPLRRAADTARAIAQAHQLTLQMDERLREGTFGDWEGLRRAEVLARGPEDQALLARWEADPTCAPPAGESLQVIRDRAIALVRELAGSYVGRSIVLVSHVGPIKSLLCTALGAPLTTARHLFLDPATISVVDWITHPVVRLVNAHEHLGWAAARWMDDEIARPRTITSEQR